MYSSLVEGSRSLSAVESLGQEPLNETGEVLNLRNRTTPSRPLAVWSREPPRWLSVLLRV